MTNPTRPSVSVLVAARNAEHDLPALLSCLERQTIDDFAVLVTDDGSTDRTAAIANESSRVKRRASDSTSVIRRL